MNERIQELINEATSFKEGLIEGKHDIEEFDKEKFAELIVRECINEIAYIGKANEVFGDRTDRGGLNHILWTTETAIEKIKEHFGVEQ
jgi:uncharacterized coiled-coil DUF342 family protein